MYPPRAWRASTWVSRTWDAEEGLAEVSRARHMCGHACSAPSRWAVAALQASLPLPTSTCCWLHCVRWTFDTVVIAPPCLILLVSVSCWVVYETFTQPPTLQWKGRVSVCPTMCCLSLYLVRRSLLQTGQTWTPALKWLVYLCECIAPLETNLMSHLSQEMEKTPLWAIMWFVMLYRLVNQIFFCLSRLFNWISF